MITDINISKFINLNLYSNYKTIYLEFSAAYMAVLICKVCTNS